MVNNNSNNNNNNSVDNMSPSELKAYYLGMKRGIGLTYITSSIREAVMLNYSRYPQLRYTRGEPMLVAQDLINQAFIGMKLAVPTPQEISLYDIITQEYGINILSSLMSMNNTTGGAGRPKLPSPGNNNNSGGGGGISNFKQKNKIPYDREKMKDSGAFKLSKEQKEELK